MKIISRYVLKHLIPVFCLALSAFVGLYLVVDFFERIDDLLEEHVAFEDMCLYFLYKLPFTASQGIPLCFLLATLIALGILKRNRELIALKAAGVSATVYTWPIIAAAMAVSILHFGFGEAISRPAHQKAQLIWQQEVQHLKVSAAWNQENVWYHGEDVIYEIKLYDKNRQIMENVSIFFFDPQFRLTQRIDARRLRWQGDKWLAEDGIILRFQGADAEQEWFSQKEMTLAETPQDLAGLARQPEDLGWLDLYKYIQKISEEGYNVIPYAVELHNRAASPLTTLIMALLGVVIALRQGLHGGIALGVGVALSTAVVYLAVSHLGSALATAGILPTAVGVWAGNILFAAATVYLRLTDAG